MKIEFHGLLLAVMGLFQLNLQFSTAHAQGTACPAGGAETATAGREGGRGQHPQAIPWNQIGAKAGADYKGDGLAVTPTGSGARLHCVFQRLDGEATPEGLWLTSTVTNTVSDRFRVTAMAVGRAAASATSNSVSPNPTSRWRVRATYPSAARRCVSAALG